MWVHVNFHFQFQSLTCLLTISTFDQPHLILWLFNNGLTHYILYINDYLCCCALHLLTFFLLYVSFRFREVATTRQPNKNKCWTWKCHISMNNRTPKLNVVSLESSGILNLCCVGELPIQWALETLKVETLAPWLHNQTRFEFELESATSPWTIGPQSWMRYHWKALIFYFYVVRASYQLNGFWRLSRSRQWRHDFTTKQIEFWTWKCHISMNNRIPKSNKVSLESSGTLRKMSESGIFGTLFLKCQLSDSLSSSPRSGSLKLGSRSGWIAKIGILIRRDC